MNSYRWSKFLVAAMLAWCFAFGQNQPPNAVIGVVGKTPVSNTIQVVKGVRVQFVGSGSSDPERASLSYYWNFGDGQTSNLANPPHTFTQNGTYTVNLTVDDNYVAPPPPGPNPSYPNEPAGYQRIAEIDFRALPPNTVAKGAGCSGDGILAGCWGHYPWDTGFHTVVNDATAPKSPGGVFQFPYYAGSGCGVGPGLVWGRYSGTYAEMREIYECGWFKIPSADFENLPLQMKLLGYWGVGSDPNNTASQIYHIIRSTNTFSSSFDNDIRFQGHISRSMVANVNSSKKTECGRWVKYEIIMKLNDIGKSNGVMMFWIDGVLTHQYTDCLYADAANPHGFYGRDWAPIYGGGCAAGVTKTRNDYLWVDHIYSSGIPK